MLTICCAEAAFTQSMTVCAVHGSQTSYSRRSLCKSSYGYRLSPGGNITIHFSQLVVADVIQIRKSGFLTLCEVDVLGTEVVFNQEG